MFNQAFVATGVPVPSKKGGPPDVTPVLQQNVPSSFADNVTAANTDAGTEYWTVDRFDNVRLISAHNGFKQVWNGQADGPALIRLVDPILIATAGDEGASIGIASSIGYNTGVDTVRGEVRGTRIAVQGGIGKVYGKFVDTVFQNHTDFHFEQSWPPLTFANVKTSRLGASPHVFFQTIPEPTPTDPNVWSNFRGGNAPLITDWQGVAGKNFRLVLPVQARSTPAPRSDNPIIWAYPAIECGATLGEVWDTCGMGYGGPPYIPSEIVQVEGLVNVVAVPEPRPVFAACKAIMTSPRADFAAQKRPDYGVIVQMFALSGEPGCGDNRAYFSVNGGPRQVANNLYPEWAWAWYTDNTDGAREVRAWREKEGKEVPGSSMLFHFFIGNNTPPPAPVNAVVSEWSAWTGGAWSACTNNTQTRTETRTRTVITPASNGGTTPPLSETRTVSQPCTPPPPPVNCALSASTSSTSTWVLNGTTYTRTTTETKTVLTAPANGGTPCQP